MTDKLKNELTRCSKYVDKELSKVIEGYRNNDFFHDSTEALISSAEYSLLAGGKRLRPYFVFSFCSLCEGTPEKATNLALALEMIHTYSLIHDDLPCMDDDDMRRGKPTNHKVFGEATALLAGDALLTEAFSLAASAPISDKAKVYAVRTLSKKAGILGMIAGQEIDLKSEGKTVPLDVLYALQERKTGMLFECACILGCIASENCDDNKLMYAKEFAKSFGLAFQITDDILDVVGDSKELGKNIGSDEKSGKSTFVSYLGLDGANELAKKHTDKAKEILINNFDSKHTSSLLDLCDYLLTRRN